MRLIPDKVLVHWNPDIGHYVMFDDTIEITDAEWNEIFEGYRHPKIVWVDSNPNGHSRFEQISYPFSQYLHEYLKHKQDKV
jgi:hypothetical protein